MANSDRSVVTFSDARDLDLVQQAAARIGVSPATFLRMAGVKEARTVLNDVPEIPAKRGRPRKGKV
jgi:hypothetical protein